MTFKQSTLAVVITAALMGCNAEDNKELENSGNGNTYAPIAAEVTAPVLYVGETVMGTYKFVDPNAQPRKEAGSTYVWRNVDTDAAIINTQELQLTYELEGQNLEFCVTPKAEGNINAIGEQECSEPRLVNGPIGSKPEANNVTILDGATPQVGDTLEGDYDFYHAEGAQEGSSKFAWKTDAGIIDGATAKTLELANELQGEQVKFCVTPETDATPAVAGKEVCSELSGQIAAATGSAPEASEVGITGQGFIGVEHTGTYTFSDADNDLEGTSTFRWLADEVAITNATQKTYTPISADKGKFLSFCVTPVSATGEPTTGTEECFKMTDAVSEVVEEAPEASNVRFDVQDPNTQPEVGATLRGNYDYSQTNGKQEGASVAFWKVGDTALENCEDARVCDYTIKQADLGKTLDFCVTPKTEFNTEGAQVCLADKVNPMGIVISGHLEYDQTLIATLHGYEGVDATQGTWKVDVSNQTGPADESNKTVQHTGNQYQIGARNSITDDHTWFAAPQDLEARDFIGKSVEYCVEINGTEKCENAADSSFVDGGLYYDATNADKRGIEPIREVTFGSIIYHRPLTQAETVLKDQVNFGANLLDAADSVSINGINWAVYTHQQTDPYKACTELYADNSWSLPMGQSNETKYVINFYAEGNGSAPVMGSNGIGALNKNLISSNSDNNIMMSPVFGWPTGAASPTEFKIHYMSASKLVDENNGIKFWAGRMYTNATDSNSATLTTELPLFASCVKQVVVK